MSDFVDFTKRSFELPSGCKDLIDVLKSAKPRKQPTPGDVISALWASAQKKGWHNPFDLLTPIAVDEDWAAHVEKVLRRLLDPEAKQHIVRITAPLFRFDILVAKSAKETVVLYLPVSKQPSDEQKRLRTWFDAEHLPVRRIGIFPGGGEVLMSFLPENPAQAALVIQKLLPLYELTADTWFRFFFF